MKRILPAEGEASLFFIKYFNAFAFLTRAWYWWRSSLYSLLPNIGPFPLRRSAKDISDSMWVVPRLPRQTEESELEDNATGNASSNVTYVNQTICTNTSHTYQEVEIQERINTTYLTTCYMSCDSENGYTFKLVLLLMPDKHLFCRYQRVYHVLVIFSLITQWNGFNSV